MSHKHSVVDDDPILEIDAISRSIINQNGFPEKILQGDHNCERLTFQLPIDIEGHLMTECNLVRVHFVNIGEDNQRIHGIEDIVDIRRDNDNPDIILFDWIISGKATRLVGKLHFCIQFACVEDGLITYSWSTSICTKLTISSSMDNTDIDDEYDKTINDVPFTVDNKNKLDGLPTGEELNEMINHNPSEYHDFGITDNYLPEPSDVLALDFGIYNICWNYSNINYDYGILFRTDSDADDRAYLYSSKDGLVYTCLYGEYKWEQITYSKGEIDRKVLSLEEQVGKKVEFHDDDTVVLDNNTSYYSNDSINSLTIIYPDDDFISSLDITLATDGVITITFPESKYIGNVPSFENGQRWELNIRNGIVVGGLIE